MGGSNYTYDGAGNRISQTVGVDMTKYLLDLQPGLATVLQATQGSDITRYLHAPRGIHAQQDASDNWTWMLQDGLGSVRSVVDSSLNPLESRLYEPYGAPFGTSGTQQTNYGFTGEMTDANDMLYLRARYYAPSIGVFTGLDPFEGKTCTPMTLNGYSWVEGNVVNAVDPTGMQSGMQISQLCYQNAQSFPGVVDDAVCAAIDVMVNGQQYTDSFFQTINQVFTTTSPNLSLLTAQSIQFFALDALGTTLYPNRPITSAESSQFQQALDYYAQCRYAPGTIGSCSGAGVQAGATATPMPYTGINEDLRTLARILGGICGTISLLLSGLGIQERTEQLTSAADAAIRNPDYDIAYRNPGEGQHPEALLIGFIPKNPWAMYSPAFHVSNGSSFATQFISLTRSLEVAKAKQTANGPIYVINLKQAIGRVFDFTIASVRDEELKFPSTNNFAAASQEVLVEGLIPPWAIKGLIP